LEHLDLDLTLLNEIADGSNEFIVESIDMFLDQTPPSLLDVSNAMAIRDWSTAAAAAHRLKATLGFFGMLSSQSLIQQIELSCKSGAPDAGEVVTKFNQVRTLVAANTDALLRIRQEAQTKL
jgi:HPt (histidine-containing phosphotransfer) domain-containing protein